MRGYNGDTCGHGGYRYLRLCVCFCSGRAWRAANASLHLQPTTQPHRLQPGRHGRSAAFRWASFAALGKVAPRSCARRPSLVRGGTLAQESAYGSLQRAAADPAACRGSRRGKRRGYRRVLCLALTPNQRISKAQPTAPPTNHVVCCKKVRGNPKTAEARHSRLRSYCNILEHTVWMRLSAFKTPDIGFNYPRTQ